MRLIKILKLHDEMLRHTKQLVLEIPMSNDFSRIGFTAGLVRANLTIDFLVHR
jgi:hypothetical protein